MDLRNETRLAIEYLRSGKLGQAEDAFKKILSVHPESVAALHFLGLVYYHRREYESAITYIRKALELGPDYVDAYNNLGIVLQETGRLDEAIVCYQKALELNPEFDRAHYNLGTALKDKLRIADALSHYQKAVELNPYLVEAYNNIGLALQDQGRLDEAEENYRHALRLKPDFALCFSNLLLMMNYSSRHDSESVFEEHLRFGRQVAGPFYPAGLHYSNDSSPSRRLRIGYVSPDFRRHSVNYFIEPVLAEHDHEHFEVFCYSDVSVPDSVTERLQGYADQWRNIVGMPDEGVSDLVKKDGIDILVDLAGHTGNNRMLVFARKPSPIQISWIGYFSTTGLSTMDYKISDSYVDPPGKTGQFYTEKLLSLPESFLCYLPDCDSPDVAPLPGLSTGRITFGSFNNFAKVTTEVLGLWVKILNDLPGSCLLLKTAVLQDGATREYVRNMFKQRGIPGDRIILESSDTPPLHLKAYSLVDIGLDTFPFNGAATTCEAMWMGVPVITLAGKAGHSRAGVSLLSNAGLRQLVAKNLEEYVSAALNLAGDIQKLKSLREGLRDMMARSPLTDAKRFTLNLESKYREIWRGWCLK